MQYHPKLKTAMQEIKEILNKHDIAGAVVLHTVGFSEYMIKIDPSYSCAKFEGENLRVKAKLEDFGGDANARNEKIRGTVNMLSALAEVTGRQAVSLINVSETVDKITGATHFGNGHSSSTQQDN